jgi:hypothetical protein
VLWRLVEAGSNSEGGDVLDAGRSSEGRQACWIEEATGSAEGGGVLEAGQSSPEGR